MTASPKTTSLAVFWVLLLSWMLGCSNGAEPAKAEQRESREENVTGPFLVTLAAPNPLSPIDPVLLADNEVILGSAATVVTGITVGMGSGGVESLNAGSSAMLKDTWSRAFALLGSSAKVNGTLHARNSSLGPGATVTTFDTTPPFDPFATLGWTVNWPSGTGSNVTLAAGTTQTLKPGLYGTVTVNDRANLTLTSGTYFLTGLKLLTALAKVTLNQTDGPVIIYVSSTLTPDGVFVPSQGTVPNLLIGYFGTTGVTLGKLGVVFKGAVIAPSALVTFAAVAGGAHTGFFAAKNLTLLASAKVQYARPTAVVKAANPSATTCRKFLAGTVPDNELLDICDCQTGLDDIDHDLVRDCIDGCPTDPAKTTPGACGCGKADTDSDGDCIPDCFDEADQDPNNTTIGQCGAVGSLQIPPKPAGTPCTDTACPQANATCNGAGVCGNRSACAPKPGCRYLNLYNVGYWLCGTGAGSDAGACSGLSTGQLTEAQAQLACSAKGLTLTRIDLLPEQQNIARLVSTPLWLGANQITTAGQWRWSAPNTNNGDQFWSGGPTGSTVGSRFAFWGTNAPGSQKCAILDPAKSGRWFDSDCNESHGYVCRFTAPLAPAPAQTPPGITAPPGPPVGPCIPENASDGGLPTSLDELRAAVDAAAADVFIGPALPVPPQGSNNCLNSENVNAQGLTLKADSGAGCNFTIKPNSPECLTDSECGAGFLCRQLPTDPACTPPDGGAPGDPPRKLEDGSVCRGKAVCVQLSCPPPDTTCRQVELCNPAAAVFDASGPDPGSNLGATAFDPARLFDGGLPEAAISSTYEDPPLLLPGGDHTWCHMDPQLPVPAASEPGNNKSGSSGNNSPIKFSFTPGLIFDVDARPAALLENKFRIHAQAKLVATVKLQNFLDQNYDADIVNATVGLLAERCSLSNAESEFSVLGFDFLANTDFAIPKFNTNDKNSPYHGATVKCNQTLGEFVLWANRVKKAYRDAQQLLTQYHDAVNHGGRLAQDLCESLLGTIGTEDVVPFFPGGLRCYENESPEITINRFLDYLQAPGYGQFTQLKQAIRNVTGATTEYINLLSQGKSLRINFSPKDKSESVTILNVPFAIGPVPMVLQFQIFAKYGIHGQLITELKVPFNPMSDPNEPQGDNKLAMVEVAVAPHASAGLSAFLGAGVDLGPFNATLGIEGSLSLAQLSAPIFGGAGVTLDVLEDRRLAPPDIQSPVSVLANAAGAGAIKELLAFRVPTAAKLGVYYKFGAGLHLENILKGQLDSRLRIKFLFFSKTWRKQILKYNGWSFHFDFVSAGSLPVGTIGSTVPSQPVPQAQLGDGGVTTVTAGATPMGVNEAQLPLTVLGYLSQPEGGAPDAAQIPFDASNVSKLFYDDLCCAQTGKTCVASGTPHCCPNSFCQIPDGGTEGVCTVQCKTAGLGCRTDAGAPCCVGTFCGPSSTCQSCLNLGQSCDGTNPCCAGTNCVLGTCQACRGQAQACNDATGEVCCAAAGLRCSTMTGAGTCCIDENQPCNDVSECCFPANACNPMPGGGPKLCQRVIP